MILPRENGSGLCRDATMPRDNLVGLIETMIEGRGNSSCALPNLIGSKDPHALKIPARKGGIRLPNENAVAVS